MAKRDGNDTEILRELRGRFERCSAWESTARTRFNEDIKFCEGDSDNLYQWPSDVRSRMTAAKRVMLTINKTKQHVLDILNDARQQKVAVKISPTGGGASYDSAKIYQGVVRHIEYISNADTAYQTGLSFAVRGGIGYWRVVTGYANDDSFDQEIFIRRIRDPLTVYLDPDINEYDGSDARFGIVFQEMPKDEFEREYPKVKNAGANLSLGLGPGQSWVRDKVVRIAEYFRRVPVTDRLLGYLDPDADDEQWKVARASELPAELVKRLIAIDTTKVRTIKSHKVEWFKVVGDQIIDRREWPGIYIPIVRVIGEETVIDGQLDRKGHVRALKDPNRMFNFNASGAVEFSALQSKSPYMAPADAIEGFEPYWDNANTENFAVLPYNHKDDEGNDIPAPQRQPPPMGAPACLQGMEAAAEQMRMVSGQYQTDMGAPSNERSGKAIDARARQGDNATFHFLDHQSIAIRFTGKILIDLIPKVYDTERVLKIQAEDGTEMQIKIDPDAEQAYQKQDETREQIAAIFNPNVGKYEVEASVGPAFQTQRQEAWNAFVQLMTQNKELVGLIGDLAFKMADFPGADEIAARLKRMVPQQALEDGPSPDLLAAQQQIQALQNLVQEVAGKLADKTASHLNDQQKNAIAANDSITKRITALKDAFVGAPEEVIAALRDTLEAADAAMAPALLPALTPAKEITAEDVMPPQQPPPAPPMAPGMEQQDGIGQMGEPNLNPDDMGAGPASAVGAVV